MNDFCDWWTPERIAESDEAWRRQKTYLVIAEKIRAVMEKCQLYTVVEVGCGAGYVGSQLEEFSYLGIDGCREMVELARQRNPGVRFIHQNIRSVEELEQADLVGAFAVLKHFSVEEFPAILKKILALGEYGLIEMNIALVGPSHDDSLEGYHHTWTSKQDLYFAIEAAGHQVLDYAFYVPAGEGKELAYVTTKKVNHV